MASALIWAGLAFLMFGAAAFAALAAETWLRVWPVLRWATFTAGAVVGQLVAKIFQAWLRRRAARRQADIGLAFDPVRRLKR